MITLEQICKRSYYRQRHIDTPLLAERLQYLQYWADRDTPLHTLQSIAQYLLLIVEYLHVENGQVISFAQIEEAANRWAKLQYNHSQKRVSFSKTGEKRFTWYALDWLKRMGCREPLPEESIPLFNRLFERRKALLRRTTAPLLKERLKYLQYWADHGAAKSTLQRIAQYLLLVIDYLKFCHLRIISVDEIEKVAEKWASNKGVRRRKSDYSKFAKARFVRDARQ